METSEHLGDRAGYGDGGTGRAAPALSEAEVRRVARALERATRYYNNAIQELGGCERSILEARTVIGDFVSRSYDLAGPGPIIIAPPQLTDPADCTHPPDSVRSFGPSRWCCICGEIWKEPD